MYSGSEGQVYSCNIRCIWFSSVPWPDHCESNFQVLFITSRGQVAGHAYHVLNRGNDGATVFHKKGDYSAFLDLLAATKAKYLVMLFGVCLIPNHFHLVVQPATEAALSPFMQWWMTGHVRRYHRHYCSHAAE